MPRKPKNTELEIQLPTKLVDDIAPLLADRGLNLNEVIRLYLRSMVTTAKRGRALGVNDEFQFGKYKDEEVGVIIRAEPTYIQWCLENIETFHLDPDALILLEAIVDEAEDD